MADTQYLLDLHCDTLSECSKRGIGLVNKELHISLDRLPPGFRVCQAFAVFMPDRYRGKEAIAYFDKVHAVFCQQMRQHRDTVAHITDLSTIQQALTEKEWAAILTIEGGSAVAGDLARVEQLYNKGVRMMTLTWNAENEICGGAATDKGFTPFGKQVVAEMERLGMAVDVSHLSDRSFYELCAFSTRPFLATHSNSRTVCDHPRNLTDDMFHIIVERGGIVGLNYYVQFITPDGKTNKMADLLRHVHHFLELGGERTLALGSDFDGADVPCYLNGVDRVDFLAESMLQSGIEETTVRNILFHNANNYLASLQGEKKK